MADDSRRTHVGAYALCRRDDCILLAHLSPSAGPDAGKWTLPGGGVEWGEDPTAAVLRELGEEAGLSGTIVRIAGIYSRTYPRSPERRWGSLHHMGVVFEVEAGLGDLRDEAAGSTDRCAWVTLAEVRSLPLVPLAEYGLQLAGG